MCNVKFDFKQSTNKCIKLSLLISAKDENLFYCLTPLLIEAYGIVQ